MDGFKRLLVSRFNESIQLKLSFALSLVILVVALVAGVYSFVSAYDEAHDLQDDMLLQIGVLFDRQHLPVNELSEKSRANISDEESRVIVQNLGDSGKSAGIQDVSKPLALPNTLSDGLHTLDVGKLSYRVLVKTTAIAERIAVAQETSVRDEIARDSAVRTLMPLLILIPILLLIVTDLVRKMFRPIAVLSTEIDQRAEQELHPVEASHLPVEIRPFVVAINRLLTRVTQSMDVQRRFVADAAHELRSPLTAISLQAQRLSETEMSDSAQERLATLQSGIERGRNLLDQLLTLAKVQAISELPKSSISVQLIYRRVLEDLMPLAEAKSIDIGIEGEQDAKVWVSELDMITMVKNLVDNAIRYTHEGGKVDLSVCINEDRAMLHIKDSGSGILISERDRVFDPFYRTLGSDQVGSGLGLSIVKTISDRIGAEIQLGFSDEVKFSGLCVRILIPLTDASRGKPS